MFNRFEGFVALRYLRGARSQNGGRGFLGFVTVVAVGGVAVGVAALLLALSIVRGFSLEIETKIIGFGAHVQVESLPDEPLDGASALRERLASVDGVRRVDDVIQEFVLLRRSATDIDGVSLWGTHRLPAYISERVTGSGDLQAGGDDLPPAVLGARLATRLGLGPGDRVTAFSVRRADQPGSVRVRQFRVSGVYETDLADFDALYVFVPIEEARDLLSYGSDQVSRFDLTVAEPSASGAIARSIEETFDYPVMARSIYEVYRSLFAWIRLQESIIPLVIAVIVLVAAFNIVGTLLMIMLEKTREVGVLRGIGATASSMRRTFVLLGLAIAVTGTLIGELLALGLAVVQQRYGVIRLPAEAYFMETAPIALNGLDFVVVAIGTVALCMASAWLPARYAARIDPMRAIHFR